MEQKEFNSNFQRTIITFIIVMIVLAAALTSCASVRKTDKITKTKEKVEVNKDSTSNIDTNKAIKDNIVINVPKSDNEEVMRLFNEVMSKMNTSKSSGTNSYKSTWDKENMQWLIEFVVAETRNKDVSTNSKIETEKSFEERIDNYVKKVANSPWLYAIIVFLLRKEIFWVLSRFFPQLRLLGKNRTL